MKKAKNIVTLILIGFTIYLCFRDYKLSREVNSLEQAVNEILDTVYIKKPFKPCLLYTAVGVCSRFVDSITTFVDAKMSLISFIRCPRSASARGSSPPDLRATCRSVPFRSIPASSGSSFVACVLSIVDNSKDIK